MKKIIVTVIGEGPVYWMENLTDKKSYEYVPLDMGFNELEEDGWLDENLIEIPLILEDVQVLVSSDQEEPVWDECDEGAIDITKKKGKYILTKNYFSEVIGVNSPFYYQQIKYCRIMETFTICLEDNEEFDPKKFQLIKSDYELSFLPYAIVSQLAMYNGKLLSADFGEGYDCGGGRNMIYSEEQPYAPSSRAIELDKESIITSYF